MLAHTPKQQLSFVRRTKEYQQLMALNIKETTTPHQVLNGTMEFQLPKNKGGVKYAISGSGKIYHNKFVSDSVNSPHPTTAMYKHGLNRITEAVIRRNARK